VFCDCQYQARYIGVRPASSNIGARTRRRSALTTSHISELQYLLLGERTLWTKLFFEVHFAVVRM